MMKRQILTFLVVSGSLIPTLLAAQSVNFSGTELLGRPTNNSVSVNVVPDANIGQLYYQYGTSPGVYTGQTATTAAAAGVPHETLISGLSSNTKYYYRMQYSTDGGSTWTARPEHSFYTRRAEGSTFRFTVSSDSHVNILLGNATTWQQTLSNIATESPDFHLDLGDTFAMDNVTTQDGANSAYLFQRSASYFGAIGHSSPVFLATGNHEQEEGWHLDDTGNPLTSQPVMGTNARKKYFINPVPDAFYSGNSDTYASLDGDHLHEDYYAWQWGDALFIVIDPFWYTTAKPFIGNTGGGEGTDTGTGDRWDWTLGLTQFNWLKQTIENSTAKYKFIFSHHYTGGSDDYVRGGAVPAHICEWGGYNEDGTTYAWTSERAGWGSDPVHNLLVANKVSGFFHGHDHQYAYEVRDGVVYHSLPAAGFSGNGFNLYNEANPYTEKVLPSPGHLLFTVSPTQTTVEYIATSGATVNHSYIISPNASTSVLGDVNGDGKADSTDALIILSCDAGMDVSLYCPMNCGDVNGDGVVNSTDALIILSYNAGLSVPYPVGTGSCPSSVSPCAGCSSGK